MRCTLQERGSCSVKVSFKGKQTWLLTRETLINDEDTKQLTRVLEAVSCDDLISCSSSSAGAYL